MNESAPTRTAATPPASLAPDFEATFEATPRPLLLIAADPPKYTMVAVNSAHARAFSTTPEALMGWGVLEVFPADAGDDVAAFVAAIQESFESVLATGKAHQMPTRSFPLSMPDGGTEPRYWAATNAPVKGRDGVVTHIVSAIQDITGEVLEKQNAETRALLMREVDHRSRNALTVVQSFVRLTQAPDVATYREAVDGRVEALARAQTSLLARSWAGGELRQILEGELSAMAPAGRYVVEGPQVLLPADDVQSLTMVLHELATNACKYGALSTPGGALNVTWRLQGPRLALTWRETGGPAVTAPARRGFGTRLMDQLARQIRGEIVFDWRPEGLSAEIFVPVTGEA